jgi:hypothetical protein
VPLGCKWSVIMLPAIDSGSIVTRATVHTDPPPETHNPDPAQAARQVLDTGKQLFTDDYEARMVDFAQQLDKGDPTYREQLMAAIFKDDPNALNSWFTPTRANSLVSSGRITMDQEGEMADAFTAAYNKGAVPQNTISAGQIPGSNREGSIQFSSLDNLITGYQTEGGLGATPTDTVGNAQKISEFLNFLDMSQSSNVATFRENYAQHLINQYVLGQNDNGVVAYHNPQESQAAAGLAANLLAGDVSHPEIAVNTLSRYQPSEIQTIMEGAARSNALYGEDALRVQAQQQGLSAHDISVPNGSALLLSAVSLESAGNAPKAAVSNADKLAVDFANLPSTSPWMFDGSTAGSQENVDSLTLAVSQHAQAVFDNLSPFDYPDYSGSTGNPNNFGYVERGTTLAKLFQATIYNPKATYSDQLRSAVVEYVGQLKAQYLNQVQPPLSNTDRTHAKGKLELMLASLTEGVRLGYTQLASEQNAKQQLLAMVVDTVLSGIPESQWADKAVSAVLKTAFSDNSPVLKVINAYKGPLIDAATGQINSTLKQQIIGMLGSEQGNLQLDTLFSNELIHTTVNELNSADVDNNMANDVGQILSAMHDAGG